MKSRPALLLLLALTVLGSLGGLFSALIQPARYQAEAFVVVYSMPAGFNNLISPDEATTINAYFAAGALQDSVIQRVRYQYPVLTAAEIRQAIQVSIVAYTPLTRVTATAASPQAAVVLANVVASAWVNDAGSVISNAYVSTQSALQGHETQLSDQIATTRTALNAPHLSTLKAQILVAHLNALESAYASTDADLTALMQQRYTVAGNTYVVTPASEATVTRSPDFMKILATSAAIGFLFGVVCILWLIRSEWWGTAPQRKSATASPAPKGRATMPIQQESHVQ
jgi:capsular polysaccharide biosynthesis protein